MLPSLFWCFHDTSRCCTASQGLDFSLSSQNPAAPFIFVPRIPQSIIHPWRCLTSLKQQSLERASREMPKCHIELVKSAGSVGWILDFFYLSLLLSFFIGKGGDLSNHIFFNHSLTCALCVCAYVHVSRHACVNRGVPIGQTWRQINGFPVLTTWRDAVGWGGPLRKRLKLSSAASCRRALPQPSPPLTPCPGCLTPGVTSSVLYELLRRRRRDGFFLVNCLK